MKCFISQEHFKIQYQLIAKFFFFSERTWSFLRLQQFAFVLASQTPQAFPPIRELLRIAHFNIKAHSCWSDLVDKISVARETKDYSAFFLMIFSYHYIARTVIISILIIHKHPKHICLTTWWFYYDTNFCLGKNGPAGRILSLRDLLCRNNVTLELCCSFLFCVICS